MRTLRSKFIKWRSTPRSRHWITAVQEQQLPWISVSDLRGKASTSLGMYNVQKLPTNFLIDKEGTLVARDIYGKSLTTKLDQLTR